MPNDTIRGEEEIRRLRSCINDLISIQALPAIWSGQDAANIVRTLLDVLVRVLSLDFAHARLVDSIYGSQVEFVRLAHRRNPSPQAQEIGHALERWLTHNASTAPLTVPNPAGDGEVRIAPFRLGLQDEIGVLVAGSKRDDFPTQTEILLLRVAANQAVVALHEARQSIKQKHAAEELERRVEERLRRSEAYLAEAQFLSHTGSWGWFVASGKVAWSQETFRIFGVKPEETEPSYDLMAQRVHPEDRRRFEQEIERAANENSDLQIEFRIVLPDQSIKHLEALGYPVKNDSGDSREFIGAIMDVTERKRAEAASQKLQSELAHVARVTTMGELAASIAHEINQPLGAIVNNGNVCLRLLAATPRPPNDMREALSDIVNDAIRSSAIVARIRAMTRRTVGEKTPLRLQAVIADVLVLARRELDERRVEVRTWLSEDLPFVSGDRVQLQQVFLNLVMNSIEAMSSVAEGQRILTIWGERDELDGRPSVLVKVQDLGVGFRPEDAHRLFDAFYTTKQQGMGMGLRISRSIVESHGGRLWAEANASQGATFLCALPSQDSQNA